MQTIFKIKTFAETNEYRIIWLLVFLVILGGIIYSFYLGDNLRFSDENDYYILAKNLISKHMYTLDGENRTAYRPPGYPWLLSLFILLGTSITHLRILNFIALGSSVYLLYLIVKKISSQFAGVVAAVLVVCYPVLIYAAGLLGAQSIGTFIFLLILFVLSRDKTISIKSSLLTGFLFGYLILMMPSFIFSFLIVILWLLFSKREKRIKVPVVISLVTLLIVFAWTARNYTVFNSFVLTTHTGVMLLDGNSENTTPNSGPQVDISKYYAANDEGWNELQRYNYTKSKAIEFIRQNKLRTVKMYFLKALNHFNYHNKFMGNVETFTEKYKDIIMLMTYGPLILLFILRMFFLKRFKPSNPELLFILLYLLNPFFFAIYLTRIRYRLPFDFLMIATAAMFMDNLIRARLSKKSIVLK